MRTRVWKKRRRHRRRRHRRRRHRRRRRRKENSKAKEVEKTIKEVHLWKVWNPPNNL
jgi:hypothetical protein